MNEKKCSKCKQIKPISEFGKQKGTKNNLRSSCRLCCRTTSRAWYIINSDKPKDAQKKRRAANPEKARALSRERYAANPQKAKTATKAWRAKNPIKEKERKKEWNLNNPEKVKQYRDKANAKRRKTLKGRITYNIKGYIVKSIREGSKAGRHWEDLVGFTIDQLKSHLERQFRPGMTWENYGQWHIDHRIPVSAFNYETPDDIDFKQCWALRNLQPLWAIDNLRKLNKLDKPFQPSLAIAI